MSEPLTFIIAVIGSSAREHALCWKLSQSPKVSHIYAIPGNAGTLSCAKVTNANVLLDPRSKFRTLVTWLKTQGVTWAIVGPAEHLAADIVLDIKVSGIRCFGPDETGAKIEADKQWAKEFMDEFHIPTAQWKSFTDPNAAKTFIKDASFTAFVIKAAGFVADGNGVIVTSNVEKACEAVDKIARLGDAAKVIIVEERLRGDEVSVPAFSDGYHAEVMFPVKVHKRLRNKGEGQITGGMGAICPYVLNNVDMKFIKENIMQHMVNSFVLAKENVRFVGIFSAQLMITEDGIKVLGFKCQIGDPEAQVLIPLLDCDLFRIIQDCCTDGFRNKTNAPIKWRENLSCVGVVIVSKLYPLMSTDLPEPVDLSKYKKQPDLHLFHGNTRINERYVVSRGGRLFCSVAVDSNFIKAFARATNACKDVKYPGSRNRTDIGWKGIMRDIQTKFERTTIQSANVDLTARSTLTEMIRTEMESTFNLYVSSYIGASAEIYDARFLDHKHPVLASACKTVGNKLNIAEFCQNYTTIGQDLVAMCVNSILEQGAKPLFFLQYFSCGLLKQDIASDVISSIAEGCRQADCVLIGGKTAEMPEFYKDDEYNLAGFVVGVVEKVTNAALGLKHIRKGDKVIYLPSSGIHSTGYGLVRKIFSDYSYEELLNVAPFSPNRKSFAEELLTPTKMYTNEVLPLIDRKLIKAFVHIADGGLLGSISKILPPNYKVKLDALKWNISPIFGWIAATANVSEEVMLGTFNCGVGAVLIVSSDPKHYKEVKRILKTEVIGEVVGIENERSKEPPIQVRNFGEALSKVVNSFAPVLVSPEYTDYKRVAVLISRTSTYLKDLLESTTNDPISPARIVLVIANQPYHTEIEIAQNYGIPVKIVEIERGAPASTRDTAIMNALEPENIDMICFTGFTGPLYTEFVKKYNGQMINIHPSLLPAFNGKSAEKEALEAGAKFTGCTVYFARDEVRSGNHLGIIEQRVVPIYPNDNEKILTERIKEQGREIFPRVLKLVAAGKVKPMKISSTAARENSPQPSTSGVAAAERVVAHLRTTQVKKMEFKLK